MTDDPATTGHDRTLDARAPARDQRPRGRKTEFGRSVDRLRTALSRLGSDRDPYARDTAAEIATEATAALNAWADRAEQASTRQRRAQRQKDRARKKLAERRTNPDENGDPQ